MVELVYPRCYTGQANQRVIPPRESLRDEERTRGRSCISEMVVFRRICPHEIAKAFHRAGNGRSDCASW